MEQIVNARATRSNLLKYASAANIILEAIITRKLGKNPLCLKIKVYSFEANITIANTSAAKYKPPERIAKKPVKPITNPVIKRVMLLLKAIIPLKPLFLFLPLERL